MMKKSSLLILSLGLLSACGGKEQKETSLKKASPVVENNGTSIRFPDAKTASFFKTEKTGNKNIEAQLKAPGEIVATVLPSGVGASQNVILFNDPELSGNYTQLIQLQTGINQIQQVTIKQKQLELERTKDLLEHGSATGQELLTAETELSMARSSLQNEKAALIEHETKLKSAGFKPETLKKAKAGTAYLICDITENQIDKITVGQPATAVFTAFPNEEIKGEIDAVADIVDNATRMAKVRIELNNPSGKLKTGMFANVNFDLKEGDFISVSNSSLITVQGNHYVFVKKSDDEFERREVQIGQQMGERIIVFKGLENDEEIAVEGVMQLKGLSFGY